MASQRFLLLQQVYALLRPFGRRRLAGIILFNIGQAMLQAIAVVVFMLFVTVLTAEDGRSIAARMPLIGGLFAGEGEPFMDPRVFWGLVTVSIILLANLWNLAGEYVRSHYAAKTGYQMTAGILRTIGARPYAYHLANNSSLLMKKANGDVQTFINGVLGPLLDFSARILMVLFIAGSLVIVDPVIALALCAIFLVFYFCFFLLSRRFWKLLSQQFNLLQKISIKSIYQFLTGIKPILVSGAQRHFLEMYEAAARKNVRYKCLSPVISNGPRYIVEIVVIGGGVSVLTWLVMGGTSIQEMAPAAVSFLYGGYRMLPNIQLMFGAIGSIKTNSFAVEEILSDFAPEDLHRVHDPLPVPECRKLPFANELRLEAVAFRYRGQKEWVLRDINLAIKRGEKVAFVGHTGSGKSTLVDLILGLHEPAEGRILVDGVPLDRARMGRWRNRIGYVPQDIFLVDESVRQNIAFGIAPEDIDEEAVREAVHMAQAEEFILERMPDGLDTICGERGVRMSGGQRQRVGLARALYHRPDILILDEATSALDNATEAAIMEVIDNLSDELTIIMIAHRLSTVQRADRIYLLKRGEIAAVGRFGELLESSDEFRLLASRADHP